MCFLKYMALFGFNDSCSNGLIMCRSGVISYVNAMAICTITAFEAEPSNSENKAEIVLIRIFSCE